MRSLRPETIHSACASRSGSANQSRRGPGRTASSTVPEGGGATAAWSTCGSPSVRRPMSNTWLARTGSGPSPDIVSVDAEPRTVGTASPPRKDT